MKKTINVEKLNALTEGQKNKLRMFWQPEKFDVITVPVCIDVDNDVYNYDIYVIKNILVNTINQDKKYRVSRYPVSSYDYHEVLFDVVPLQQTKIPYEIEELFDEDLLEESAECENGPEKDVIFINKKDCLPVLGVSKMMDILYQEKCKAEMFAQLNKDKEWCRLGIDGFDYDSDCLCDSLWEALKSLL